MKLWKFLGLIFALAISAVPSLAQNAQRFVLPYQYVADATGVPIPGAKLFFYASGTTTPLATYSNIGLTVPNANPVQANAAGLFPNIFMQPLFYKVVLTDSFGKQIWAADPVGQPTPGSIPLPSLLSQPGPFFLGNGSSGTVPVLAMPLGANVAGALGDDLNASGGGLLSNLSAGGNCVEIFTSGVASCGGVFLTPGSTTIVGDNGGVLFGNGTGTLEQSKTLPSGLTIPGPTVTGTLTINPTTGQNLGINLTQTGTGTSTGVPILNELNITDEIEAPVTFGFYEQYTLQGNWNGAHSAQVVTAFVNSTPQTGAAFNNIVAIQQNVFGNAGDPTHTTSIFGGNTYATISSTGSGYNTVLAWEFDVGISAFATDVERRFGIQVVSKAPQGGAGGDVGQRGTILDSAYLVGVDTGVTWGNGYSWFAGAFDSTSNIMGGDITAANYGINFNTVTFTTCAFASGENDFCVTPASAVLANSVAIGGSGTAIISGQPFQVHVASNTNLFANSIISNTVAIGAVTDAATANQNFVISGLTLFLRTGSVGTNALSIDASQVVTIEDLTTQGAMCNSAAGAISTSTGLCPGQTIAAALIVGTTTISGGSANNVLTDTGTVLAEQATSGTGNVVRVTSPSLVTPALGAATATSINGITITSTTGTVTIANSKTLTDTSGVGADLLLGATGGGFAAYGGVTCTNQFLSALSAAGSGTCTTDTLASAQHANQGTTTTVLHGNAAGNPSWAAVSLTADVTGIAPLANGGTNANLTASNGGVVYSTASAFAVLAGTATANQCLLSGSTAAPSWGSCGTAGDVASVGNASADTSVTLAGTGSGPFTGAVTVKLNLGNAQTWTAAQTFTNSNIKLLGSSTGTTTLASANGSASNFTATIPAATDIIVELTQTQTLTNKTISFSSNTLTGVAPLASPTFTGTVSASVITATSTINSAASFQLGGVSVFGLSGSNTALSGGDGTQRAIFAAAGTLSELQDTSGWYFTNDAGSVTYANIVSTGINIGAGLAYSIGGIAGITEACTIIPTGLTISGGIITAKTGGTCTP